MTVKGTTGDPKDYTLSAGGAAIMPKITTGIVGPSTPRWKSSVEVNLSDNSDFQSLVNRIGEIEKRLYILQPSFELHEKYQSLKEAYEAYKIIEALVRDGKS